MMSPRARKAFIRLNMPSIWLTALWAIVLRDIVLIPVSQNWFWIRVACLSGSAPSASLTKKRFVPAIPSLERTALMNMPENALCSVIPMTVIVMFEPWTSVI